MANLPDGFNGFVYQLNSSQKSWKAADNDVAKDYLSSNPTFAVSDLSSAEISRSTLVGPFGLVLRFFATY